ncbi:MAG: zinc ABC transporter ATP-binding protein [Firmicutes bacterium HGW-Firmicutes-1]|jgi:zinc transport system ATP-binding protein|nr:MAG: zinc ABC transporter ATP-binding protein [Firmicutes bacterium HGW-Firmicutes-1]
MKNLVEVNNLNFGYHNSLVLKDINFTVKKGDFLGIIGANGSGKSTLIKMMLRILDPWSGEIKLFGENIQNLKSWNKVGYISQKANSFNGSFPATVEEVVLANLYYQIGPFKLPQKKHKEMVFNALEKVGMQEYRKSLIGSLSGGQQQRVFLARVLVGDPEILILDEPTVGIDLKAEEALYCLLARINQELGLTVIMVTHDIGAITIHANRLICLGENGMFEHNPKEGMTSDFVSEFYGYDVNLHAHNCDKCTKSEVKSC